MTNANEALTLDMTAEPELLLEDLQSEEPGSNRAWLKKLPALLRTFGAMAVLFSLYSFFARGWEGSSDMLRYLMLLGHTGALAAIGLASGHFLKEGKGARLLLTLAMVSVVANFAILGAFIFSVAFVGEMGSYPHYVAWTAADPQTAVFVTLGSLLLLLPVVRIGFLTLARGVSSRMTLLFLLGNAALLLPVRSPMMVTLLTVAMALMLLVWCGKSLRQSAEVKTREGMAALALQFLPICVLIGRNLWLYSQEAMLYTVALFAAFIALRQLSLFLGEQSGLRNISEKLSLILAASTGVGVYNTLLVPAASGSLALVGATMVMAAMCYELSLRANRQSGWYRSVASVILVTGLGANLLIFGGLLASLLTIAVGLLMITLSYMMQQRGTLIGGVLLLLAGMGEQLIQTFQSFDMGYWAVLAVSGVLAIVIGSVIESRGGQIKSRLIAWKSSFSEWSN